MICWDRHDERIIGTFTPRQIRWIREHVSALPSRPVATHERSSELLRRTFADTIAVLETLPTTGGVVILPSARHVWAWIWSLTECAMHLAARLGLAWAPATPPEVEGRDRNEVLLAKVTSWLTGVIDSLIRIAELNYTQLFERETEEGR